MTREEFIGKLRSIYVGEENAIDEIISEYDIQKRTIQYLSECINEKDGLIIAYREEIQRLNNIINELEKDLKEKIKYWEEQEKGWIEQGFMKFGGEANNKIIFKGVLDKLKELKKE